MPSHTVHWTVTRFPCQAGHSDEATARRGSTFYASIHVQKQFLRTPPPLQANVRPQLLQGDTHTATTHDQQHVSWTDRAFQLTPPLALDTLSGSSNGHSPSGRAVPAPPLSFPVHRLTTPVSATMHQQSRVGIVNAVSYRLKWSPRNAAASLPIPRCSGNIAFPKAYDCIRQLTIRVCASSVVAQRTLQMSCWVQSRTRPVMAPTRRPAAGHFRIPRVVPPPHRPCTGSSQRRQGRKGIWGLGEERGKGAEGRSRSSPPPLCFHAVPAAPASFPPLTQTPRPSTGG